MKRETFNLIVGFLIGALIFYGASERVWHLDAEQRLQNCLGSKR